MVPSISDFSVTHDLNSVRSVWNILAHSFDRQTSDCFGLAESQRGLWELWVCAIFMQMSYCTTSAFTYHTVTLCLSCQRKQETGCDVIEEGRAIETQEATSIAMLQIYIGPNTSRTNLFKHFLSIFFTITT